MRKKSEPKHIQAEIYRPNYVLVISLLVADFTIIMMVESQFITLEYVKVAIAIAASLGLLSVVYTFYSFHVFNKRCHELLKKLEDEDGKELKEILAAES